MNRVEFVTRMEKLRKTHTGNFAVAFLYGAYTGIGGWCVARVFSSWAEKRIMAWIEERERIRREEWAEFMDKRKRNLHQRVQ